MNISKKIVQPEIQSLYYIAHFDNIVSIIQNGIYSHNHAIQMKAVQTKIDNPEVNSIRASQPVGNGVVWDYANLYFQPRNAMLYQIMQKIPHYKVAILGIKKDVLFRDGVFISTGNAASRESEIINFCSSNSQHLLKIIAKNTDRDWWSAEDGSKRRMMAECLVPKLVPPELIHSVYVATQKAHDELEKILLQEFGDKRQISRKLNIVVDPKRFFQPEYKKSIGNNISLARGDMFFSKMQTLTVSVNCVGVMGKGLASTAKNRFPDVYVRYQNLCRQKRIRPDRPCLLKRESSVAEILSNESLGEDIQPTWFLLFATKQDWRNNSRLEDIEKGLQWLVANYEQEGIESLAMPALGCGLGGLSWQEVGPLMCSYLSKMKIQVVIYLPAEKHIEDEWLSSTYLLNQS